MTKYNYEDALYDDIADYVRNNKINLHDYGEDQDAALEKLEEELWEEDCITGNGGDGYATTYECEEFLCHNLPILSEATRDFGFDLTIQTTKYSIEELPKVLDSIVRCYLLDGALWKYVTDNWG